MGKIADLFVKIGLKNDGFNKGIDQSKNKISGFANGLKKIGGAIAGFFAFQTILTGIKKVIGVNIQFEKSLSTLKSLTGVTTEELKFYAAEAKRMGETTTQTASQVAKAFTLIGSKKPELLANKEALVAITEQAIILAEAANIQVPQAANALANSLNQMGEGANKAEQFINALAAGSKFGAGNIEFLNAAIEKAGGSADAVGLSFEELVAGIETIAPKITEPTTAGLQFRQVLVKLASGVDKFNPTVVGLSKALHNLQGEQLTINELTAKFGILNINAAKALIDGADSFDSYTKAVTGTNTALEQQADNIDNASGDIDQLTSAWEGLVLKFQKSQGVLRSTLQLLTDVVRSVSGADIGIAAKKGAENIFKGISDGAKAGTADMERVINIALGDAEQEYKVAFKKLQDLSSNTFIGEGLVKTIGDVLTGGGVSANAIKQAQIDANTLLTLREKLQAELSRLRHERLKNEEDAAVASLNIAKKTDRELADLRARSGDIVKKAIDTELEKRIKAAQSEVETIKSVKKQIEEKKALQETASIENLAGINKEIESLENYLKVLQKVGTASATQKPAKLQTFADIEDFKVGKVGGGINEGAAAASLKTLQEGTSEQEKKQAEFLASQKAFNAQAASLAADFVTDTVVVFADGIGQMLAGDLDIAGFGKALLSAVGGFLSSLGKMMIQFGATALVYSILAKALSNPVTAGPAAIGMIAAGAALVAIGGAISGAAGNGGGGGGGGAITTIDTRGGRTQSTSGSLENTVAQPQTIFVEGEIRNSVIAISNAKGIKENNR